MLKLDGQPVVLPTETIETFRASLRGDLLTPGSPDYDDARSVWNAMIDRRPALIARCSGTADVVSAVNFARDNGLLSSVRCGGHNIAGQAICEGGLVIDLSRMNGVWVDPDARLARAQAGCRLGDVDRETQLHGLAAVMGFVSTTGAAGVTVGGGFGYLTRKYGWTCDNLRSVEVVTADGVVRTASAKENPDLFWALRGGGGNFGIVTSFEYELHPVGPEIFSGAIAWRGEDAAKVLEFFREFAADAPRELTCVAGLRLAPPAPWLPREIHGELIALVIVCHCGSVEQAEKDLAPLKAFGKPVGDVITRRPYVQQQAILDATQPDGRRYYWKSDWLADLDAAAMPVLIEHAEKIVSPHSAILLFQLEGALNELPEDHCPAGARGTKWVLNVAGSWERAEDDARNIEWTRACWSAMRPFSTKTAYVNFMTEEEGEDRIHEAYGTNHERLRELKAKWDPQNLFRHNKNILPAMVLALAAALPVVAQQQTVGLFLHDPRAEEGYTLMSPRGNATSYLLDNDGLVVHTWTGSYPPGSMAYMMEDGHLVRAERLAIPPSNFLGGAGRGGYLEKFDWDGTRVWEFMYSTQEHLSHHDIELLPDGNVLMIAWEYKTYTEALQAGRDPGLINQGLWPDHVIEVQPTPPSGGIIVWEWHVWDHLVQDYNSAVDNFGVVAEHPELVDINYVTDDGDADWTHVNGIAYNAALDQIVISVRRFDEFWVIDHSTSTSEAAGQTGGNSGKGGDLLYRWGNPQVYGRGTAADHRLFGQHDAHWIDPGLPGAGNFLVYDNGVTNPAGQFSFVKEIVPPVDEHGAYAIDPGEPFGPHEPTWVYPDAPDPAFYSGSVSGVQRQPGGTSLICEGGSGHLFEVTPGGELVWDYVNPVTGAAIVSQGDPINFNRVFKVRRYPPDYPAFDGRDLTPGDPLENFTPPYPTSDGSLVAARLTPIGDTLWVYWDADSCQSFDYKLIYGRLDELPDHASLEAVCGIGVSGSYSWSGVPADSLYFLVVGTDPTGVYESSWGVASDDAERNSTTSSFTCGTTTKIVSSQCP